MIDLISDVDALLADGTDAAKREAEMRIAAARVPLDERVWLLRAVARSRAATDRAPTPRSTSR